MTEPNSLSVADSLHTLTLGDVLREHRRSRPQHLALIDDKVRMTYRELDDRVNRLTESLRRIARVGQGGRIVWMGQNSFRLFECLLAAAKLGAITIPVNWRQTADEFEFVLDDVDADVVVWQETVVGDSAHEARGRKSSKALWLQHDATGIGSYEEFLAASESIDREPVVQSSHAVLGLYTAAFEGRPSAALLSHDALIFQSLAIARVAELSDTSVFLNSGPLFHVATFMSAAATFQVGGTNVFIPRADPELICRTVESERCNRAFIVGTTLDAIKDLNADGRFDLSSLWGNAAPSDYWPCTPSRNPTTGRTNGYGQTETMGLVTFLGLGQASNGSHGRPLPIVQLRIVDVAGNEVAPGQVGELVVRGPTVQVGYLNRPELNAARRLGSWYRTSDLGRREDDGSITFIGPITRLIKSGLENIYPAEVEACIAKHPGVAGVAVLGVPDAEWGQSVKAVIVPNANHAISGDEIIEHCKQRIASYKKPRFVEIVNSLPRRPDGTVDRMELDRLYGGGGYPGQGSVSPIAGERR
jgi:long-chain acyl-CoA synthetase